MSILRKPIESPFDSRENEIDLSVVVPCFNEEQVLPELEQRLSAVCEASVATSYEIVLVNDGSTDKSGKIVAEMSARNPNIIGIELSRNFGHQIALTAGLSFARGNRVLVIDADLQDPPELLPEMLRIMDQGANIVNGKREERAGDSNFKRHSAKWFYKLIGWFAD